MSIQTDTKKYITLKLKSRNNKNYHKKKTTDWYTVTSLLQNWLIQRLTNVTSFRLSKSLYSQSILFKYINSSGFLFPALSDCEIYETKFQTQVSFLFSTFFCSYQFYFFFDTQNLPFVCDCSHVITLPVSCYLLE